MLVVTSYKYISNEVTGRGEKKKAMNWKGEIPGFRGSVLVPFLANINTDKFLYANKFGRILSIVCLCML